MARSERIELEIVTRRGGAFVARITTTPERAAVALSDYLADKGYDEALWDDYVIRVPAGLGYEDVSAA